MLSQTVPRITALSIQNYRVLKNLQLKNLTPLSVFIGSNGSGKSTLLEALTFLSDCFQNGLKSTCQKSGGLSNLKSHGNTEPIQFQISYIDFEQVPMTYTLVIQETNHHPYIETESLTRANQPILNFSNGHGWAFSDVPQSLATDRPAEASRETFSSPDTIAVNTLGQFSKYPHLQTLRQFISHWFLVNLTSLGTQTIPISPDYLSSTGDNLTNVIENLQTNQPEIFQSIVQTLTRQIPRLTDIQTIPRHGRPHLHIQDNNTPTPIPADQASNGTLLLLAYLLLLELPSPHSLLLVDEPENNLHPRLMIDLGEKFRASSAYHQIIITTHSPYFVDTLRPEELWILHRESDGFTQACRASDIRGINAFIDNGSLLGELWMENFLSLNPKLQIPQSA